MNALLGTDQAQLVVEAYKSNARDRHSLRLCIDQFRLRITELARKFGQIPNVEVDQGTGTGIVGNPDPRCFEEHGGVELHSWREKERLRIFRSRR